MTFALYQTHTISITSHKHINCWCNVHCRWCWAHSLPLPWRSPTSTRGRDGVALTSSHEQHTYASTREKHEALKPLHLLTCSFWTPLSKALFPIFIISTNVETKGASPVKGCQFCTLLSLTCLCRGHGWTMRQTYYKCADVLLVFEVCCSLFWFSPLVVPVPIL